MSKKGFTLVEIAVTLAIAAVLLSAMSRGFAGMVKSTFKTATRFENGGEVDRLASRILRETRLAQSCQATATSLVCRVDMHSPPTMQTSDDSDEQYVFDRARKRVQFSRRPVGGNWRVVDQFNNIGSFAVCGDNQMIARTCPIKDAISARHVANLTAASPTPANRFFRIQIQSSDTMPVQPVRQIAVFVRHPLPLPGYSFEFASRD